MPSPCSGQTDLFFSTAARAVREAKAICKTCPQRQDCLTGALERQEANGVWGGVEFPAEARRMQRLRQRARRLPTPTWLAETA